MTRCHSDSSTVVTAAPSLTRAKAPKFSQRIPTSAPTRLTQENKEACHYDHFELKLSVKSIMEARGYTRAEVVNGIIDVLDARGERPSYSAHAALHAAPSKQRKRPIPAKVSGASVPDEQNQATGEDEQGTPWPEKVTAAFTWPVSETLPDTAL